MEERLRTNKEKMQEGSRGEFASSSRRMVRNMDPFERQRRQMN